MAGPPPKLHIPFDQWPELDRRMWTRATSQDDPFAEAPGARLAKTTLHSRWMAWRRFLGFLHTNDPDAMRMAPASRVTPQHIRAYARHLAETNSPYSVGCQVDALYGAIRLLEPGQDWDWLRQIKKRLFAAAPPTRRGPVITSIKLLDLGVLLMRESEVTEAGAISGRSAAQYRDGLMIAMAAYLPLRHKNFAAIELGRHLVEEGDGWVVSIPAEESKTKVPIDFEVPVDLRDYLMIYLKVVRPRLLRNPACQALWVSAKGDALAYSAVGPVFTRNSTERLGIRVTPHNARDAAATLWAISSPGQIEAARDLLAHEKLETTNKYYNRARGIEASRRQARLIANIRKASKSILSNKP